MASVKIYTHTFFFHHFVVWARFRSDPPSHSTFALLQRVLNAHPTRSFPFVRRNPIEVVSLSRASQPQPMSLLGWRGEGPVCVSPARHRPFPLKQTQAWWWMKRSLGGGLNETSLVAFFIYSLGAFAPPLHDIAGNNSRVELEGVVRWAQPTQRLVMTVQGLKPAHLMEQDTLDLSCTCAGVKGQKWMTTFYNKPHSDEQSEGGEQ